MTLEMSMTYGLDKNNLPKKILRVHGDFAKLFSTKHGIIKHETLNPKVHEHLKKGGRTSAHTQIISIEHRA